jgi:hypothetical protein
MYKLIEPNSIMRHSEGFITKHGLRPMRAYENAVKNNPASQNLTGITISSHSSHQGHHAKEKLPDGTLDRLSLSYNFMFTELPKHHVDLYVTNGHNLRLTRYTITREETLQHTDRENGNNGINPAGREKHCQA